MKYEKISLTIKQQIDLLKSRWLIIEDEKKAFYYLEHIWYFRFSWYLKYFQNEDDFYIKWTSFDQVLDYYILDRKLRLLVLDAIEKIEVSLKANLNNTLSEEAWCFWYTKEKFFNLNKEKNKDWYKWILEKNWKLKEKFLNEKSSSYVKNFFQKYSSEDFLPSWMFFEELSIWDIEKLFRILDREKRVKIATKFNTYEKHFITWISLITVIRNICAHHWRLWNRKLIIKLKTDDVKFRNYFQIEENNWKKEVISNFYNSSLVISYLLKMINKNFHWIDDLEKLLNEFPNLKIEEMWFERWWKNKIISWIK